MRQLLFFTGVYLLLGCNSSPKSNTTKTLKDYAYVISTNYVKDYLKAPSSVDFDYFTANPDVSLTNGVYTIRYHFQASNSFGAKIQSNYTCDLIYKGGAPESKENWQLKALSIDGNIMAGSFEVSEGNVSANGPIDDSLKRYYHIERTSGNGYYLKVYVYLANKSKMEAVNNIMCQLYNGKYSQVLDIWYFDKKNFVDTYLKSIDDPNISDAEFKRLDKHLIATYEQEAGSTGSFDLNK
jgi:hypothetical protein